LANVFQEEITKGYRGDLFRRSSPQNAAHELFVNGI
jgi:hypothetical protein